MIELAFAQFHQALGHRVGRTASGSWYEVQRGFVLGFPSHVVRTPHEAELRRLLNERGVDTSANDTWSKLVDHALSHFVEPELIQPTILHDYPVEVSQFARPTDDDPSIVERFEFFVGGMELGNAFTEINDPDEQAERFAQQAADAQGQQGDPDYVEALAYGMPPTGGLGLGIDRLAMVLTGKENIRDTILFPALRERD